MKVCSKDRVLVYDCEANGLLDKVTIMWCIAAQDYETGEMFLFHDYPQYDGVTEVDDEGNEFTVPPRNGSLKDGALFLHKAKGLIAHNQLGYDQFLLKKFFPKYKMRYNYPEIRDTLLESQVQWFDRRPVKGYKGIHGLAVWGARLGIRKPEIEDWSFIDALKLHRCIEDIKINTAVAKKLEEERQELKDRCDLEFIKALTVEHKYRYYCTMQELNGACVDIPHMKACVKELDVLLEELRREIEPQLPPTVGLKSGKISKSELFKALGLELKVKDRAVKIVDGEEVVYEPNDWAKPCTKWTTSKVQKYYGIVNKETGEVLHSIDFPKLKEARDYAKEHFPDVKKFLHPNREDTIVAFDANTKKFFGDRLDKVSIVGNFTKISIEPSTMSQHEKVKLLLVELGWDTDEWTFKKDSDGKIERASHGGEVRWPNYLVNGNQVVCRYKGGDPIPVTPKITEASFATLPEGLGKKISEYNTYSHRRKFIENPDKDDKGLLNNIREDGRISCGITSFGTTAGRASHYGWVNAPGVKALYGEKIRQIIIAPKGNTLLGVDMPSAHPRILADFTQNDTFIKAVDGHEVDPETGDYLGEDFHTVNSVLFKLNTQEEVDCARATQDGVLIKKLGKWRGIGKGGSYACLYGGSGKKIAITIGASESEGEALKGSFLAGLGLDGLLKEIKQTWKERQWKGGNYITVLGDYHIWCSSEHKIINYKALGSEAVVQKYAVIWVMDQIISEGLTSKLIINSHDELLFDCPNNELERMTELASNMYPEAAKQLGLTLDWSSAAMSGHSYAECH